MNYLKSSLAGLATIATLIGGAAMANAQSIGTSETAYSNGMGGTIIVSNQSNQTATAMGSAASPVIYIPTSSTVNPTQTATIAYTASNLFPLNNYSPGYYSYFTANTAATTTPSYTSYTYSYPGAPATGGPDVMLPATANPSAGTYVAPNMTLGSATTGGISLPVGYAISPTVLAEVNRFSYVTTNSGGFVGTSGSMNGTGNYVASNGQILTMNPNGQVQVNGIVSTVTPTALAISSGNNTWSVTWNGNTSVTSAGGVSANANGAQVSVGDTVTVTGTIDALYPSQIDATSINDLSLH